MAIFLRHDNQRYDPQIDHQTLLQHLVLVNKSAIALKYLQNGNAIFSSEMKYNVGRKTCAVYNVIATIPLTDPIFNDPNLRVSYIYPSKAQNNVVFIFNRLVNNSGYEVFHIE